MTLDRFSGVNAGYVLELYEKYRQDPQSVDPATREVFEAWAPADATGQAPAAAPPAELHVIVGTANLAESIRRFGHLAAKLDPLGSAQIGDSTLLPKTHGITDDDLKRLPASLVGGPPAESSSNAYEAIEKLRRVYCSTTGFDIAHLFVPEERAWMREAAESGRYLPLMDRESSEALLDRLTQVEVFERFLQRTFTGKTRFSIEGLDMLIPVLDEVMAGAAGTGTRHLMLGMAHRGRLNVLAHILQKPYAQILAEFKDPITRQILRMDLGWMGDVKYHAGRHHRLAGGTHVGVDGAQPQPSRSGEPGRRRHGPRRGHAGRERRRTDLRRRDDAASADPRRRRVPRPGHRGRNAQPVAARRLPHGRHDPHHRQQPARLHRHARRVVQHQLRQRPRARVQDPDRPRERRRSDRLSRGGAAGVGIPGAVPQGFPDRPGRLSPPRPQRRRRAGVHAADDVSRHQRAPDGARALRHVARQARPPDTGHAWTRC